MAINNNLGRWIISGLDKQKADAFLKKHAPWRILLEFDSGPCSKDYGVYEPFSKIPLAKQQYVFDAIGAPKPRQRLLDIGFNLGYNSLEAARRYGVSCIGIDVWQKHKDIADELADIGGLDCKYLLESAEEYENPNYFDYILHFGVLYHLMNPARSIEKCAKSLRSGGWLAIETIKYIDEDPALCRWIYGFFNDKSNYWALGELALKEMCEIHGLTNFQVIVNLEMPVVLGSKMVRVICAAQKE